MKVKNKGKVHPSPSSSSTQSPADDIFSVLKILPAAILILVSVLSLQDREVLAFMVTRSLKSSDPSFSIHSKNKKKAAPGTQHETAAFDCDCFSCYTSYWCKWDSSANRELIHQAIEAFEEHLNNDEQFKKNNGRSKKKDKMGRRDFAGKSTVMPEITPVVEESEDITEIERQFVKVVAEDAEGMVAPELGARCGEEIEHKGLARKVLPDIMGLLNSRLWSLWSPNV